MKNGLPPLGTVSGGEEEVFVVSGYAEELDATFGVDITSSVKLAAVTA